MALEGDATYRGPTGPGAATGKRPNVQVLGTLTKRLSSAVDLNNSGVTVENVVYRVTPAWSPHRVKHKTKLQNVERSRSGEV